MPQERQFTQKEVDALIQKALTFQTEPPERQKERVQKYPRVSRLQRAGHCRSIGCLGFWTGRDGNGADVFDPGRGLWRGLWSLCFFLDDRDAAPLL